MVGTDISSTMSFGEVTAVQGTSFLASSMTGILGFAYNTISVDKLPTFMDNYTGADKSFSFYLHHTSDESYMTIPGMDSENYEVMQSHTVKEQKYWGLNLTTIKSGDKTVDASKYIGVIDSGTSLLVGSSELIGEIIKDVKVSTDCSNKGSLPDITFTIDTTDYVLSADDYVLEIQGECLLGIQSMSFPSGFNYIIMGDVFMRRYPTKFSLTDNTVSF